MSRIGKEPVALPAGVTAKVDGQKVTVKGKLGELAYVMHDGITAKVEDGKVVVERKDDTIKNFHGLARALIHNNVVGVSEGYKKQLVIEGTGFKAALQGKQLALSLRASSSRCRSASPPRRSSTSRTASRSPSRTTACRSRSPGSARRSWVSPPRASAASIRPNPTRARASSTSASTSAVNRARRWPNLRAA